MANPVTKFQILSKTPDGTTQFYDGLFGWTVNPDNLLGYRQLNTGSEVGIQESGPRRRARRTLSNCSWQ